jgi:hypothetical protein
MNLPVHRKSGEIVSPNDLHKPIAKGLATLDGQVELSAVALTEQYEILRRQAQQIIERRRVSSKVYEAQFGFEPIIMGEYHLYLRPNGKTFVSMVGPTEWGRIRSSNFAHVARIKLDYDHTWEILDLSNSGFFDDRLD